MMSEDDASGNPIREYIWLNSMPVALVDHTGMSPVLYFIHTDHLNRPQKLTDGSAALVWDAVYQPFGEAYSVSGTATNLLMFPGQFYDSETALAQNWHREYDATLGRYIQSDPIGLLGGINTYGYVGGNPLGLADPSGLFNPTKGLSALGNILISGFTGASGATKIAIAAGLSPASATGVGALPPLALLAWGTWNLKSSTAAFRRAVQQWNEALCENWSDASLKNFWGMAPGGTNYDDPGEPSGPFDYIRKDFTRFISEAGYF
jgi:RHS repeat-associated protein